MKDETMSDVELDENELFNNAVSDEPETPVTEEPVAQEAAAEQEVTPETEVEGEKPPIPPKPEWRLKEDAERARQAEKELADERAEKAALRQRLDALERANRPAEPKVEKAARPDPLLDPEGYAKAVHTELREEMLKERQNDSMAAALEANPDEFKAAYKAATENGVIPELKIRMQNSRNPGKELLSWHKEQQVKAEVGTDPNAWLEKKLEERLKDPAFLAKAVDLARGSAQPAPQSNGRPRVELPPSLTNASRSNAALQADSNDVSDRELFTQIAG